MLMAAGGASMQQGRSSPSTVDWSNLPDDLLGMIRSRVVYPRGRIRFAAACRSWRAAASRHLPLPGLPLLVLSLSDWGNIRKHLYCPQEGRVLQVSIPSKLHRQRFCGSYDGGWIAAITKSDTFVIVNLFSGVEVALSSKQRSIPWKEPQFVRKIIFSEGPTSSGCVLAAMTTQGNIALCCVGCPDGGWTPEACSGEEFGDIVFCRGELYGLAQPSEKLFKFDIGVNQDGALVVTAANLLDIQWRGIPRMESWFVYIFALRGQLAMAMMARWLQNHNPFFKVFELAPVTNEDAHDYEWKEVRTLGDCALFLGPTCASQVIHVQAGGHGLVEQNHIYNSNDRFMVGDYRDFTFLAKSESGSHIYCLKDPKSDGKVQISSEGYYLASGLDLSMWCFPPSF